MLRLRPSEVTCPFLEFHGTILVVVNDPVLALRAAQRNKFFNNFWHRIRIGADGSRTRTAPQRSHAATDQLRLLPASERNKWLLQRDQRFPAHRHPALLGKVERHNGDLL